MLRRAYPWPLLVLLALAGCSRCGERAAPAVSPARFVPREAQAALVVADLGTLGEKLARFQKLKLANFLAQLRGLASAEAWVSSALGQLGVDLRSRQALEAAGIDPSRGAAAALLGGDQGLLVLGVKDAKALEATFATFARTRLGATERAEQRLEGGEGGTLVSFSRPGTPQPLLGVLLTRGCALVGAGPLVPQLASFSALPEDKALPAEPLLSAALGRLPAERDFYVWLPGTSPLLQRALRPGAVQALTLAGTLSERSVVLRADAALPQGQPALQALEPQQSAPELLGYLPEDSFLVARFRGDPARLEALLPSLVGPRVSRAVQESGFDLKAELLERMKTGWVLGVALAPTAQLGGGLPALDVRRTNPFRFVHLVAVAESREADTLPTTLEKLPAVAQRFGATMQSSELSGRKVLLTSYSQGEGAHLAAVGDKVVLAAPQPRLEEALTRLASPPGKGPVAEELRGGLQGPTLAVVLDWRRLAESVKALPSQAWGIGGFAIKATTVRWLEATDDLRGLSLGLSARDSALQAELTVGLSLP